MASIILKNWLWSTSNWLWNNLNFDYEILQKYFEKIPKSKVAFIDFENLTSKVKVKKPNFETLPSKYFDTRNAETYLLISFILVAIQIIRDTKALHSKVFFGNTLASRVWKLAKLNKSSLPKIIASFGLAEITAT